MFKPANPNSRIPAVLQAHTKENIIFQLTLVVVYVGGAWVYETYKERQERKQRESIHLVK